MKLSDLFEDYINLEEIKIVRVLNLNTFFAVLPLGKGKKNLTMVRFLDGSDIEEIKNNRMTAADLVDAVSQWHSLQEIEAMFDNSELKDMIESAKEMGYVWENGEKSDEKKNRIKNIGSRGDGR